MDLNMSVTHIHFSQPRLLDRWLQIAASLLCITFSSTGAAVTDDQFFSIPTQQLLQSLTRADRDGIATAIKSGANVNEIGKRGITPIIYSVIMLNRPAVEGLLALNANPNIRQSDGHNALTAGYELSRAAPEIFTALINSGKCNLNVLMPDDEPMIYYLAASRKLDFLALALKKGANHSLLTRGQRPLVIAAALLEEYDAVELLLDAGASASATDAAGTTLLEFVSDGASKEVRPKSMVEQSRLRLVRRLQALGVK